MCMEDIRIGRMTTAAIKKGSTGTTWVKVFEPNPDRVGILLGWNTAAHIWYGFGNGSEPDWERQVTFYEGSHVLRIEDYGRILTRGFWFRGDSVVINYRHAELILPED